MKSLDNLHSHYSSADSSLPVHTCTVTSCHPLRTSLDLPSASLFLGRQSICAVQLAHLFNIYGCFVKKHVSYSLGTFAVACEDNPAAAAAAAVGATV